MIRGQAFLDGIDIANYGLSITKGGYNDLLTFPPIKDVYVNDWQEEDGIEPDLKEIKLKPKEAQISFHIQPYAFDNDFTARFTKPGYHTFEIPALQTQWKLRVNEESSRNITKNGKFLTLKVTDDFPQEIFGHSANPSGYGFSFLKSPYALDGTFLNEYGIIVKNGQEELEKMPAVKSTLSRDISIIDGIEYDTGQVTFKEKEIHLNCCFLCDSISRFKKNYIAFFNQLIQPGERGLYSEKYGKTYRCYYKSTDSFQILSLKNTAIQFNLTLVLLSFRINETDYLLTTEDNLFIITEDNIYFLDLL